MTDLRLSKQPFTLSQIDIYQLNDALIRIQDELDRLAGLRGVIALYDSAQYIDDTGTVLHAWGVKP